MKKILLGAIAAGALSTTAFAADLPARPYTKAPPIVTAAYYDWSGFYVGINGGGGSAHECATFLGFQGFAPLNPPQSEGCGNATGGTIGGQVGYRWQASNWVFGLEAQGNWANLSGSNLNQALAGPPGAVNDVAKINGFGLFTGQVGYAFNNVLMYAKGGAAVVSNKYSSTLTAFGVSIVAPFPGTVGQTFNAGSDTRWGGTVGAGIEFGFAPHWSVALEYDHLFMGTQNVTLNVVPLYAGAVPASNHAISEGVDIGTVRVNYTFGGPVVAKY